MYVNATKIVIISDDPESLIEKTNKEMIVIYPRTKRPSSNVLLRKNIKIIFSSYARFPDIDSLKIIRNILFYLINTSEIKKGDVVEVVFKKRGEFHRLLFDTDQLEYMTIYRILSDRLDGKLIENILKLSMNIARMGIEGRAVGALLVIGDSHNVRKYIIQKYINPVDALPAIRRNVVNIDNLDILRPYVTMDGATIINEKGDVLFCGSYIKILDVPNNLEEMGGRHLAAKSISKLTKAIAFVISSEGKIKIYRDGKMVYQIENF